MKLYYNFYQNKDVPMQILAQGRLFCVLKGNYFLNKNKLYTILTVLEAGSRVL
jgi:hypothetical protein